MSKKPLPGYVPINDIVILRVFSIIEADYESTYFFITIAIQFIIHSICSHTADLVRN